MSNVLLEYAHLAELDSIALVQRADVIKTKLQSMKPDEAPEDVQIPLLHELACIAGMLRKRSVNPPSAKRKTTPKRAPAPTLDSVL